MAKGNRPQNSQRSLAVCSVLDLDPSDPTAIEDTLRHEPKVLRALQRLRTMGVEVTWVIGGNSHSVEHLTKRLKPWDANGIFSGKLRGISTQVHTINRRVDIPVIQNTLATWSPTRYVAFEDSANNSADIESLPEMVKALLRGAPDIEWVASSQRIVVSKRALYELGGLPADLQDGGIRGLKALLPLTSTGEWTADAIANPDSPTMSPALQTRMKLLNSPVSWQSNVKRISVITAMHVDYLHFADEALQCIESQKPGCEIEWCLQLDGVANADQRSQVNSLLAKGRSSNRFTVSYGENGRQAGIAVTRNAALDRATGDIVCAYDIDDILEPFTVAELRNVFQRSQSIGWAVMPSVAIGVDNDSLHKLAHYQPCPRTHLNHPVALKNNQIWTPNGDFRPEHLFAIRTPLARVIGGWVALPTDEDFAFLHNAAQIADGVMQLDGPSPRRYRRWPGQITQQDAHPRSVDGMLHLNALQLDFIGDLVRATPDPEFLGTMRLI